MKFLDGEDFKNVMTTYVKSLLIKGAPAIMQDLREFYNDALKTNMIEEVLLRWHDNMEK